MSGGRLVSPGESAISYEGSLLVDARRNRPAGLRQRQRLGDPDQHRPPDSAPVRAPTSARSTCWSPIAPTWCWPRRSACGPKASAACGCGSPKAWPASSPSRCGRRSSPTRPRIRASSTSREAGEDPYRSFLGVPIVDRGLLQGVLVVQTIEPRVFDADDVRHAGRRPARSWRRSSARRARSGNSSRRRTSGCARWRRTSGGAGTTTPTSLFRELDPALWRELDHNPIALLQQMPIDKLEERASRAGAAQPHQLRLPPDAGVPAARRTPGARGTPACCGRGRSPTSRPSSACTSRCRSTPAASGILAGDHIKSASDLGIPLVGVGLYYDQGYFRQRLDRDGWQHEDYIDVDQPPAADAAGDGSDGAPVIDRDRDAHRHDRRPRLAAGGRPQHAAAARLERRRQPARGSRADGAALRRRRARPHPPGAAARRRRRAGARRAGHRARRRCTSTKATARSRRSSWCGSGWPTEGVDAWRGDAPRRRRRSSSRRTRRCRPATTASRRRSIEEHLGPLREALGLVARRSSWAWAASIPTTASEDVLHDGAGAQDVATAPTPCRRCTARCRARCGRRSFPDRSEDRVPIGHITNGVHVPTLARPADAAGLRPAPRARLAAHARRARVLGARSTTIDDGELWETHQTLKAQLIDFARRRAARQAERRGESPELVAQLRRALEPRRADDRLRAPVRHLQARQPDPAGSSRLHRLARQRPADARCSSSSPARRIRTTSRARRSCSRSPG